MQKHAQVRNKIFKARKSVKTECNKKRAKTSKINPQKNRQQDAFRTKFSWKRQPKGGTVGMAYVK
jgi:hypothetical protein